MKNHFSTATRAPLAFTSEDMGLIIDIQLGTISYMTPDDAKAYLEKLSSTLEKLRDNHTPVTWVTIGNHDQLYMPAQLSSQNLRLAADLEKMDFYTLKDQSSLDPEIKVIFENFIKEHGPRGNEAVYCKTGFGAFETPGKGNENPNALACYMNDTQVKRPLIMGAVSSYCVMETAIGAAQQGFLPTLLQDRILSWQDASRKHLFWSTKNPNTHVDLMNEHINSKERQLTPAETKAIERLSVRTSDQHFTRKPGMQPEDPSPANN